MSIAEESWFRARAEGGGASVTALGAPVFPFEREYGLRQTRTQAQTMNRSRGRGVGGEAQRIGGRGITSHRSIRNPIARLLHSPLPPPFRADYAEECVVWEVENFLQS